MVLGVIEGLTLWVQCAMQMTLLCSLHVHQLYMTNMLSVCEEYAVTHRLKFNLVKTQLIHFWSQSPFMLMIIIISLYYIGHSHDF